ncbi:MAG: TrmH family RNA methyltransferase [Thermoguttaceae bacterium]|nr:TrmH family RNA methyltransferase [Thermoguttaceae bacterium]
MEEDETLESQDTFVQLRHQGFLPQAQPPELIVACPPMRSNVNVSRIARAAGCCGVTKLVLCGTARLIPEIARDAKTSLELELHRTLQPVLKKLKVDGYEIVGLEQSTNSVSIYEFVFQRRMVLVIGNERSGIDPEILRLCDRVVEIPVYGLPFSHNAATATAMAMYEYCRQMNSPTK